MCKLYSRRSALVACRTAPFNLFDVLEVVIERADGHLDFDQRDSQGDDHRNKARREEHFARKDVAGKEHKHAGGAKDQAGDAPDLHVANEFDSVTQIPDLGQVFGIG